MSTQRVRTLRVVRNFDLALCKARLIGRDDGQRKAQADMFVRDGPLSVSNPVDESIRSRCRLINNLDYLWRTIW